LVFTSINGVGYIADTPHSMAAYNADETDFYSRPISPVRK